MSATADRLPRDASMPRLRAWNGVIGLPSIDARMLRAHDFASRIANCAVGGERRPGLRGSGTPALSPTAQYPGLPTQARLRSVSKTPIPFSLILPSVKPPSVSAFLATG